MTSQRQVISDPSRFGDCADDDEYYTRGIEEVDDRVSIETLINTFKFAQKVRFSILWYL